MKPKPNKVEPPQPDDDDRWTWVVIGVIYFGITVALYAPFVWERLHGSA